MWGLHKSQTLLQIIQVNTYTKKSLCKFPELRLADVIHFHYNLLPNIYVKKHYLAMQ